MIERTAQWVCRAVKGTLIGSNTNVSSVVTDSREIMQGSLFVARRGENSDGHQYLSQALSAGATCALVEHYDATVSLTQILVEDSTHALGDLAAFYLAELRACSDIKVVAITGSAGKTTTKDLLLQILSEKGPTVAPKLSFNNEVGVPLTILRANEDTQFLVLEMGASGIGHLTYLTSIAPPDIAIVLMVGVAHLGGYGSADDIAQAKGELVQGLRSGGVAVLNADDTRVCAMASLTSESPVFFSAKGAPQALVKASDITLTGDGNPHFTLSIGEEQSEITMGIIGVHNVSNALAASGAAYIFGCSISLIATALNQAHALSPHRLDVTHINLPLSDTLEQRRAQEKRAITLIDDSYNANPDSMRAAITSQSILAGKSRKVCILGEMLELGPTSADLHREIGQYAQSHAVSVLITVGDMGMKYIEGMGDTATTMCASNIEGAIELAYEYVRDGDCVLVKGSLGSRIMQVADSLRSRSIA